MDLNNSPNLASSSRVRKRARKACLYCRSRKVRCDVSTRGCPCMNCYLDDEACVIPGRSLKKFQPKGNTILSPSPTIPTSPTIPQMRNPDLARPAIDRRSEAHLDSTQEKISSCPMDETTWTSPKCNENCDWIKDILGGYYSSVSTKGVYCGKANPVGQSSSGLDVEDGVHVVKSGSPPDVLYSYYPFLVINNIRNIPPHDFNFLDLQGCLRLPSPDLLHDLIQQYFLHVHPILPLLNEGDFWDLYFDTTDDPSRGSMSLLVFQAMLFASCNFVSLSAVRALGYPSIRALKASYYRRAKLLYDFRSESSPLPVSQAALLLSFTALSECRQPYISWLSIAIENAKMAEAHLYAYISTSSTFLPQHRNILKRLWWCCIIRDRSTGLLLRRPIQITKYHFNFASQPLCVADFEDEFERSNVYDTSTKKALALILSQWSELNIVLTDILMLVFPLNERQDVRPEKMRYNNNQLGKYKLALDQWLNSVISRISFPVPARGVKPRSSCHHDPETDFHHSSVILYTNLMLMYYHTSRMTIAHYEVLQLDTPQTQLHTNNDHHQDISHIRKTRQELRDAASCITECHKELVTRGLDRWLPVSAIGCTILPLILHILDTKLDSRADSGMTSNSLKISTDQTQSQLSDLIHVMKTYEFQYDSVDWVAEIVRHTINLVQLDDPAPKIKASGINWTDVLVFQPKSYLRLTFALDMSLRKGRLAKDDDFPTSLRRLLTAQFAPTENLIEDSSTARPERPYDNSFEAAATIDPSAIFVGEREPETQEQPSMVSSTPEACLGILEDEIYLHLAGGVADDANMYTGIFDAWTRY